MRFRDSGSSTTGSCTLPELWRSLCEATIHYSSSVPYCINLVRWRLLDDVKFDLCNTPSNHSQRLGRRIRNVDISSCNERTAVIDPNRHGPSGSDVCHAQPGAEWQRTMSGSQFLRIELLAARRLCSLRVEAGKSMRPNLCLGCIFVRRERGMLFRDRHTRHERCLSILSHRCLSTGSK